MSTRPLRQYYDGVAVTIPPEVSPGVETWRRHRRRFTAALATLTDEQWKETTRCTAWDAKDVIGHLVAVDSFWVLTLSAAQAKQAPATFLRHFDPSTGTDALVDSTRGLSNREMLDRFVAGTDGFVELVATFGADDWDSIGESPLGHLPAGVLFAHAFWDSWLHERDIFEPLGLAPHAEQDEILAALCFSLLFGGMQGGLIADPEPVGVGLDEPVDVTLSFDELPGVAVRVQVDTGVRVSLTEAGAAHACGSATDVVECYAGRLPLSTVDGKLPSDLAAQCVRATQVF
ncbi:MAG: maleylpyruvate isomerase family mycothiol-dependent enzyme [Actinomycetota bacterium]|nr:maleylpyruvate isomerase family mycothiol-dependent enzyme [Actinomycetota bacterium]